LLQAAEQFQANGFKHEIQKDGVSCGVHLIEAAEQFISHFPQMLNDINVRTNFQHLQSKRLAIATSLIKEGVVSQQFCSICGKEDPSNYKLKKKGGDTEWLGCENCKKWFHFRCLPYKKFESFQNITWYCRLCGYLTSSAENSFNEED